ncbi:hypothetical protein [Actinomycetospora corticicola]|uniref:Transcriptional regulator with XRE-family HTH domain n=1 Tax=Actinomycetospora corticicola TaxID=663602 RepID=A0A7Y9DWM9_9PSEU|nr:hypothetical protein [Actinomycetospora corticicola]NYD36766.1 transcriptional regulator with XRE-family HTH domain [Actinomycetospora corticicola]
MPDDANLRSSVRAELARQGLSARAMNARLGWGLHHLTRRLSGEVEFRSSELEAIASELGIPVSRFYDPPRDAVPAS